MKLYIGNPQDRNWSVYVHEITAASWPVEGLPARKPLRPRFDLANHSPDGFAWGYAGSGPAQLALALLADALGNDEAALRLHQPFKNMLIAGLPQDQPWALCGETVRRLAATLDRQQRQTQASDPQSISPLLEIQELMDGVEWTPETLDQIAQILIKNGYRVRDLNDVDLPERVD